MVSSVGRNIYLTLQHGIKRTKLSSEAAEAKRIKELSKIQAYVALQEDVLAGVSCANVKLGDSSSRSQKRTNDYSKEALRRTNELLDLNPEFYTIWNYRRNILTRGLFTES
jgi:geranylgeranyl transferase type-2 subunit alpha